MSEHVNNVIDRIILYFYISNASVASGYKMLGNVSDPSYQCISTYQTQATGARALVPPSGRVVNIIY